MTSSAFFKVSLYVLFCMTRPTSPRGIINFISCARNVTFSIVNFSRTSSLSSCSSSLEAVLKRAEMAAASTRYFTVNLLLLLCFTPQCCTRSHARFAFVCLRSAESSQSKYPRSSFRFPQMNNGSTFFKMHLLTIYVCQVRCGTSRAGEAGEGDRAWRDSADDRGTASGRQNLQCVLPTWRPLPAGGEFWLTAWMREQETGNKRQTGF